MAAERDALRAQVVDLQDALARAHEVADLQEQAAAERAATTRHLLNALSAAERADDLRRRALAVSQDALAAVVRPGHPGDLL